MTVLTIKAIKGIYNSETSTKSKLKNTKLMEKNLLTT